MAKAIVRPRTTTKKPATIVADDHDIQVTDHSRPPAKPSLQDLEQVVRRLELAGHSLRAMHQLSIDAQMSDDRDWYLVALREMSRSTFKGIDACIQRLNCGVPAMGNFADEFDLD